MHRYGNEKKYGCTKARSFIQAQPEPEPEYEPEPVQPRPEYRKSQYLPGERLLKTLNNVKIKPLDLKTLEKSISEILSTF
jgi:hypothetical protein